VVASLPELEHLPAQNGGDARAARVLNRLQCVISLRLCTLPARAAHVFPGRVLGGEAIEGGRMLMVVSWPATVRERSW
jgi:hypothetical protein